MIITSIGCIGRVWGWGGVVVGGVKGDFGGVDWYFGKGFGWLSLWWGVIWGGWVCTWDIARSLILTVL